MIQILTVYVHLIGKIKGIIVILQQVLNLMYKLPEEGTGVSKQVAVLKVYTDLFYRMYICLLS